MQLKGLVAIITGGAKGIGKAIVESLLEEQVKVYVFDVDEEEMKKAQKRFDEEYGKGQAVCIKCDVTCQDAFENAVERIFQEQNRLDILCNNAGIPPTSDIKKLIDTNLTSVIRGTIIAMKYMDTKTGGRGGNIIQMGSMSGLSYYPAHCEYTAAKHGIIGFTKGFAKEAFSKGVRINCICPSCVDTDMLRIVTKDNPIMQQAVEAMGVQTVDVVAKGFLELLHDEERVGEVMRITVKNGIDFHKFPEEPVPMPLPQSQTVNDSWRIEIARDSVSVMNSKVKIEGSVAIVTGGARGIGKAITDALLHNKAKVYFLDIDVDEGKNVQNEFEDKFGQGKAIFLECNVTNYEILEAIISKVVKDNGHLDILVNNAGIGPTDDIEKLVSINLAAVIRGTLLGVKYMDKKNGGRGGCIVNMGSAGGLCYIPNSNCAYIASKHGVVGFTRTYAKVAIESGIRLNCICPSIVDTDLLRKSLERDPTVQQFIDQLGTQTVDVVAEGFIQLLNDVDKVGEAMRISVQNRIDYHKFSEETIPL
ncbi:uncharacterized protein LOC114524972 [Dendronephthya gigantea]|uniref:uncharacterized protein LOC114524972 n=1 Tax=Dendronephthya gigantea TaxID=151771 RepID=UPI00106D0B90|nr:uncharacterized protein LOC114524972 [Dendronephthya gigantea]